MTPTPPPGRGLNSRTEADLPNTHNPDATQTEMGPASASDPTLEKPGAVPSPAAEASFPSFSGPIVIPPDPPTAGPLVGGRIGPYELLGEIARGGMGVVYRARHPQLDRTVALKMVLGFPAHGDMLIARFEQEAKAAAALDHPNVVPIYEIGQTDGRPYFTMALVEGGNLKELYESRGRPPVPETVSLFAQIVAGVAHAHAKGIIHRDLKPANVLIDRDGRPRVTDFGLAKRYETQSELTGAGQIMGTPSYMAPEQARETKDVGPPADVYALGAILYYMLTGRPPFTAGSTAELYFHILTGTPDPVSKLNPAVPPEVEAVCMRCLVKNPADRYPDATALAAALAALGPEYALSGSRPGLSMPAPRPAAGLESTAFTFPGTVAGGPATPPSRKLPLILTAAAVSLAIVAVGVAMLKPGGKGGVVQSTGGPPAATPPVNTGAEPTEKAVALATVGAADFPVKAELLAKRANRTGQGVTVLPEKTPLVLRLEADRDCYALVWTTDPKGDVAVLFPNKHETDARLVAGRPRTIPGNDAYDFPTFATEGDGAENLHVVVRTKPFPPLPEAELAGAVRLYASGKPLEAFRQTLRGVTIRDKADHPPTAELKLDYRVER